MMRLTRRIAALLVFVLACAPLAWGVKVTINATPAGATVTALETGQRLAAPATFDLRRSDTPYNFRIERDGYDTEMFSWSTRDRQREFTIALQPLSTEKPVTILSDPEGAGVTIDGKPAGTTPLTVTATFFRDSKSSPWKPLAVALAKADYQGEQFSVAFDRPAPPAVTLSQLRKARDFLVDTKAPDGSAIQAALSLDGKELGAAPRKVSIVFSRADKTKAWPTFALRAEIPTIYQPAGVTLTPTSA
jgi:hypothetical protein